MAIIVNDRDILLQAASVRFVPPTIPQDQVDGLPGRLDGIETDIAGLEGTVDHLMNTSGNFGIRASAMTFIGSSGTTVPSSITLTAIKGSGLTGSVTWSVFAGGATLAPSGDVCSVIGSSVTGTSVTVRARLVSGGMTHDAYVTLQRLGAVAATDKVNLTSQVTGALAAGNVSGLGALALLNTINLNTQTTGALNGQTQVTNLGALAYANAIAANQIGAGTLAAGVIYAGDIVAEQITAGTIEGVQFKTTGPGTSIRMGAQGGTSEDGVIWGFERSSGGLLVSSMLITPSYQGGSYFVTRTNQRDRPLMTFRDDSAGLGNNMPLLYIDGGRMLIYPKSGQAPLNIGPSAALPADRSEGNVCMHQGWLCFANGTHWFRSDGERLT